MEMYILKKSKQLWSLIYSIIFIGISIIVIVYPIGIIYNDVIYFNKPYLNGKLEGIKIEESNSPESAGYYMYIYSICINGNTYFALTDKKFILEIDDQLTCFQTGTRTVKIIYVNGKKIQNKYGAEDYISIIILLSIIVIIVIVINKGMKK